MKKIIFAFILFLTTHPGPAQNFEIGGEFGFGKTTAMEISDLFGSDADNNFKAGILASFNPNHTILFINSGLLLQMKGNNQGYLENLKMPVGVDLFFGKKLGFVFGGGLYLNYFYSTTGKVFSEVEETKTNFQLGAYFDIGGKYNITDYLNIALKFQMDFDLTPVYEEGSYSAGGWLTGRDQLKSKEYSGNLSIMYRLHKKNKK
ncbi:MAG: hypothetical protein NTU98_04345 [Bacteroidetes bacterium]|nr:hypothetical protein [Bacteroidota bacterium]